MLQKLLDKFFPIQFHVRVVRHSPKNDWYCVQYQYGRWFLAWEEVRTYLRGTGYNPIMGKVDFAEKVAKSFETYEDVVAYQLREEDKRIKELGNVPYEVKNIL